MSLRTGVVVLIVCLFISSFVTQGSGVSAEEVSTPVIGTLVPSSGAMPIGSKVRFTITCSDQSSWQNLSDIYLLFANQLYQTGKAYIRYSVKHQLLYVRNDVNTSWGTGVRPGSREILESAFVRLYAADTKVSVHGTTVTLEPSIEFKPMAAASSVTAWGLCVDLQGQRQGWKQLGTFSLVLPARRPVNVYITPNRGIMPVREACLYLCDYWDRQADFSKCHLLINTSVSGLFGAFVMYDAVQNKLYVRNDSNTAWIGGYAPGTPNIIENTYCKLYCNETKVLPSGNLIGVIWWLEMKPAMSRKVCQGYMYVTDREGNTDGWDTVGYFTFDSLPQNNSVTPASGPVPPAKPLSFTSKYSDADGASAIKNAHLMINKVLDGKNASWVMYDQTTNKLYVRNAANTEWVGGSAPGSDDIIESEYCRLYCKDTSITRSGNTLTVNWNIELKRAKAGEILKAWMYTVDNMGKANGWDQKGIYEQTLPINETISYLARVMDQYHSGNLWVYKDAGHPANSFAARGSISDGPAAPLDELCTDFPERGTVIKTGFTPGVGSSWGGWYLMNGTLTGDQKSPIANWGTIPNAGVNLRAARLSFLAKGVRGDEKVEFFYGGVGRVPSTGEPFQPYPDSSSKISTGIITLTQDFKRYTIGLTGVNTSYTLGAFGWVVSGVYQSNPGVTIYIDDIRFEGCYRLDEPRFLQSYEVDQNSGLAFDKQGMQNAYLYDNSVALIAFAANNYQKRSTLLADAVVAAVDNDRFYSDGRVRNAYAAGTLLCPPGWTPNGKADTVRMPGYLDNGEYNEDEYCISTSTGVCAWAALALLTHYQKYGGDKYLQAAIKIAEFIENNTKSINGYLGGFTGWEPNAVKETYSSTEHNIDVFALGRKLYAITGDARWQAMSDYAKTFIISKWDPTNGKFDVGTNSDGSLNQTPVALDCQAWSLAALGDCQYADALSYAENHLMLGSLFSFGNTDTSAAWIEGSAQMAVTYDVMNTCSTANEAKYQTLLAALELQKLSSGGMNAATDELDTGLYIAGQPWKIYPRPHVGATAWMGLAESSFNPLGP